MKKRLVVLVAWMLAAGCASETVNNSGSTTDSLPATAADSDAAAPAADVPASGSDTLATPDTALPPKEDGKGGGMDFGAPEGGGNGGPASCVVDADCTGANCVSPLGCSCFETPDGKLCVPHCKVDADCPDPPNIKLQCAPDGFCKPSNLDNPGTACKSDAECVPNCKSPSGCKCSNGGCAPNDTSGGTCTTAADCAKSCPPGAKGCTCITPPGMCAPICETSADCPSKDGSPVECKDGACAQQGG